MKLTNILRSFFKGTGGRIGRYVAVEEFLGLLARPIDLLMIYFILKFDHWGVWLAFFVGGALYMPLCAGVVYLNDYCQSKGYDLTGIEELRTRAEKSKILRWILKRKATIFLIGSWCKLDPDYVTLLLRDRKQGTWASILKLTAPSVLVSMVVWTGVYWGACIKGIPILVWIYDHI